MEEISIGEFARRSRLSLKALRLYDERGVLVPSRVDQSSGYRYYDPAQLEAARLVAMMRELQLPLAAIKELLACDPADAAARIAEHWRDAEAVHDVRRDLADYLINRLSGKKSVVYEVATRQIPERSLLCMKRNVYQQEAWAFGKEFMTILRERPLPRIEGEPAFFSIYWGLVNDDSDGPMEMCRPVPALQAGALAEHYPELTLRTDPAHREAFVALPASPGGISAVHVELAIESLQAWEQELEQRIGDQGMTVQYDDLGLRLSYFWTGPVTDRGPDCEVAAAWVER